jgi:hypothetical protein
MVGRAHHSENVQLSGKKLPFTFGLPQYHGQNATGSIGVRVCHSLALPQGAQSTAALRTQFGRRD